MDGWSVLTAIWPLLKDNASALSAIATIGYALIAWRQAEIMKTQAEISTRQQEFIEQLEYPIPFVEPRIHHPRNGTSIYEEGVKGRKEFTDDFYFHIINNSSKLLTIKSIRTRLVSGEIPLDNSPGIFEEFCPNWILQQHETLISKEIDTYNQIRMRITTFGSPVKLRQEIVYCYPGKMDNKLFLDFTLSSHQISNLQQLKESPNHGST